MAKALVLMVVALVVLFLGLFIMVGIIGYFLPEVKLDWPIGWLITGLVGLIGSLLWAVYKVGPKIAREAEVKAETSRIQERLEEYQEVVVSDEEIINFLMKNFSSSLLKDWSYFASLVAAYLVRRYHPIVTMNNHDRIRVFVQRLYGGYQTAIDRYKEEWKGLPDRELYAAVRWHFHNTLPEFPEDKLVGQFMHDVRAGLIG